MPRSGLEFDKKSKPLTKRILNFFEKARYAYLSALEDKTEYGEKWKKTVKQIQKEFDGLDNFTREMKKYIDEDNLFDKEIDDPESASAQKLWSSIKEMRFKSDKVSDPFSEQLGDKVIETLLKDDSVFMAFIHFALRSHSNALPDKMLESNGLNPDEITDGEMGLDLKPEDIPLYITEHYGDDKDTKRIKTKFEALFKKFKSIFTQKYDDDELDNLLEIDMPVIKKEDEDEDDFIIPNKPMYRIFEIGDMEKLKGFTGEFLVQEKYDGMRIQIHKKGDDIKIYSFNGKDITDKCPEQVEEMKGKQFSNCILDAELMLFKGDEALHRAETVKHVFQKETEGKLRAHVFDVMKHEKKDIMDTPLRERINILFYQYSEHSSEALAFPSKKDTRIADSLKEINDYSMGIMALPTAEGVVIKDMESTYYLGTKKNPKWVKWKKFVDLDVIILDKKKTRSNLHSYTMGIGPLSIAEAEEYKHEEYDNKKYIPVGKALNTKKNLKVGSIMRVKVDEVKRKGNEFSLYSAKFSEIPEVTEPDKLTTVLHLSEKTKKSLGMLASKIGDAFQISSGIKDKKKSYFITDNIHGDAEIILKYDLDGFTIYGFEGNELMQKNALYNIDVWKEQLVKEMQKANVNFTRGIYNFLKNKGKAMPFTEIVEFIERDERMGPLYEDLELFDGKREKLYGWMKSPDGKESRQNGILYVDDGSKYGKFKADPSVIMNDDSETNDSFKIFRREDGNLNIVLDIKGKKMSWTVRLDSDDDIYELFGKSGKFPAIVSDDVDEYKLLDEGKLVVGVQKHGYHEYKIIGDKFETRMHFRVIPVKEKKSWLVWTGKKQEMLPETKEKGIVDISEDKFSDLPFPEEV